MDNDQMRRALDGIALNDGRPFTPKFVDLVRNFTTVEGTGPASLGVAVSGYTSLAEALSAGDQFYYCIQGVDRPDEREVGRGTLLANGTVARQAISGPRTEFSQGSKTIALVAAADWFKKRDQASPILRGEGDWTTRNAEMFKRRET